MAGLGGPILAAKRLTRGFYDSYCSLKYVPGFAEPAVVVKKFCFRASQSSIDR
jgi:hypothetical protein